MKWKSFTNHFTLEKETFGIVIWKTSPNHITLFFANSNLSLYQSAYSNSFEVFDNWPLIYNKVLGIVYSVPYRPTNAIIFIQAKCKDKTKINDFSWDKMTKW